MAKSRMWRLPGLEYVCHWASRQAGLLRHVFRLYPEKGAPPRVPLHHPPSANRATIKRKGRMKKSRGSAVFLAGPHVNLRHPTAKKTAARAYATRIHHS